MHRSMPAHRIKEPFGFLAVAQLMARPHHRRGAGRDSESHGLVDVAAAREGQDHPCHHAVSGSDTAGNRHHRRRYATRARGVDEDRAGRTGRNNDDLVGDDGHMEFHRDHYKRDTVLEAALK